jgi:predicted nucleic acid-binding protein
MSDKVFVDTNVLVYAYDSSQPRKHAAALELVLGLWQSGQGVLSTQVLQEFYVVITRKVPRPLAIEKAREIVSDLMKWEVFVNGPEAVVSASDLQERHGYSFWDSLILHAAITSKADTLATEDMKHGASVGGVTIVNPFA